MPERIEYERERLVAVLIYHQRLDSQFCACGWGKLGASHAEHIADCYEFEFAHSGPESMEPWNGE